VFEGDERLVAVSGIHGATLCSARFAGRILNWRNVNHIAAQDAITMQNGASRAPRRRFRSPSRLRFGLRANLLFRKAEGGVSHQYFQRNV
ncbi:MAG: hypothetical protein KDJ78_15070, partial [Rhodobacteraceae bacterium]|nr:hypothetical protein [Paracoccaceae bacterium]